MTAAYQAGAEVFWVCSLIKSSQPSYERGNFLFRSYIRKKWSWSHPEEFPPESTSLTTILFWTTVYKERETNYKYDLLLLSF